MADRIELTFLRAAERLIPSGGSVLTAVSGGGDSVALLHLLARYARRHRITLGVVHLDHALRPDSLADRTFVEILARDLNLPVRAGRRDVAELRRRDESHEEAARRVRRAFLLEQARAGGFERIATGHNLDDQAETILMRLVRGAGATALTGMTEIGPGPFVRPLLKLERGELRNWLQRRDLAFREDPTNRDLRFDRNRTRRVALPALAEALNRRAARHLVRAADAFREDALHLDELARAAAERLSTTDRRGRIRLDARELTGLAPVLARRVARLVLMRAGVDGRRLTSRHVEGLVDLAGGAGGRRLDLPNRRIASRSRGELRIEAGPDSDAPDRGRPLVD